MKRRKFNKSLGLLSLAAIAGCSAKSVTSIGDSNVDMTSGGKPEMNTRYKLSLAQWSCHRMLNDGKMDNLDFAKYSAELGFQGVEYVSAFLQEGLKDASYWDKMNEAAKKANVEQLLIMTDLTGSLGAATAKDRKAAVDEHIPWLKAAKALGCHSIRVNLWGEGNKEEQREQCTESLITLSKLGADHGLNIIVENHGGLSSDGKWLTQIMKDVSMDNCGTLPDFGNFCVAREGGERWGAPCIEEYDRYLGVEELMPYAKAVSAKSHVFDRRGNELNTDYTKMMEIVHKAGYSGYVGVEWEGDGISETEGIKATKMLLERTIAAL